MKRHPIFLGFMPDRVGKARNPLREVQLKRIELIFNKKSHGKR
jgi:hypothetical protein